MLNNDSKNVSIGARQERSFGIGGSNTLPPLNKTDSAAGTKAAPLNKTFTHGLTGETVTLEYEAISIPAKELAEKVKLSISNPRFRLNHDFEERELYQDLKRSKLMKSPSVCYRVDGSREMFIANGGTRYKMILQLLEEGIEIDFQAVVYNIKKAQMWVVEEEVTESNSNLHFTTLEQYGRFLNYAKNTKLDSQRQYRENNQALNQFAMNGVAFKQATFLDPLIERVYDIAFLKSIKILSNVSIHTLLKLNEYLTGVPMSAFDALPYLHASEDTRKETIRFNEEKLNTFNESIDTSGVKNDKELVARVKAFLDEKLNPPKPKEENVTDNESTISIQGKDLVGKSLNEDGIVIGALYLKENNTSAEMRKIEDVLEKNKHKVNSALKVLQEVNSQIESELSS